MAEIDDFLWPQVAPQLLAGEQVMGFAFFRRHEIADSWTNWIGTATNWRLILFRTEERLLSLTEVSPKPLCLEVAVWWYQEIREVSAGYQPALFPTYRVTLIPHPRLGPYDGKTVRYDMPAKTSNVARQEQMAQTYGNWLKQQVDAGAFPLDAERKRKVQEILEREEREQQERAAKLAALQASAGNVVRRFWPLVAAVVPLIIALVAAITAGLAYERMSDNEKYLKREQESVKTWTNHEQRAAADIPKLEAEFAALEKRRATADYLERTKLDPEYRAKSTELEKRKQSLATARTEKARATKSAAAMEETIDSSRTKAIVTGALCPIALLGTLLLVLVWFLGEKRRKKAAGGNAQGAA